MINEELQGCLDLEAVENDLAKKLSKARKAAEAKRTELRLKIANSSYTTGDGVLDMAIYCHSEQSATVAYRASEDYRKVEDYCAANQSDIFFAVQVSLEPGSKRFIETFYVGRIESSRLRLYSNAVGLCEFPVPQFAQFQWAFYNWHCEKGVKIKPEGIGRYLSNDEIDITGLYVPVKDGPELIRRRPIEAGMVVLDAKQVFQLEICCGMQSIHDWLANAGPFRTKVYDALVTQLLIMEKVSLRR